MVLLTFRDNAVFSLEYKPLLEAWTEDQMWIHFVLIYLRFVFQVTCCKLVFVIVQSPVQM